MVARGSTAPRTLVAGGPVTARSKQKPATIDEYLAALSAEKRAALQRLRRIIQAAAPRAEECISYQLPAFRVDGRCFIYFGAAAEHCAIYGAVGPPLAELKDYDTSKGTIRFRPDRPLPAALVRKLVKARLDRQAATSRPRRGPSRRT